MLMYDIAIIGSGMAGYTAALEAAKKEKKVALIERKMIGGTCLNRGCIPTKTYLRISREIMTGMRPKDRQSTESEIKQVIKRLRNGLTNSLNHDMIDIYRGTAEIVDRHTVLVKEKKELLNAKCIVIASGSLPNSLCVPGIDSKNVFTTDHAFDIDNILPSSIAIIGGGVIGIEFAYLLNSIGAKVYLIEMNRHILQDMGSSLADAVEKDLAAQGVTFFKESSIFEIDEADDESIISFYEYGKKKQIVVEKVLVAIGRKPNIMIGGIDQIGIKIENGRIKVNAEYQTSVDNIYAIGDVAAKKQLAYTASHQAKKLIEILYDNIVGRTEEYEELIPQCVYIHPEIAAIGINEEEAKRRIMDFRIGKYSMYANGMAHIQKTTTGFIKLIINNKDNLLIGAELYCENAVDIIPIIESFMINKTGVRTISEMYFPHPSFVEGIKECIYQAEL